MGLCGMPHSALVPQPHRVSQSERWAPIDDEGVGEQKRGLGRRISMELDERFLRATLQPACMEKHHTTTRKQPPIRTSFALF